MFFLRWFSTPGRIALGAAALALIARIAALLVVFEDRFYFNDEQSYYDAARYVMEQDWRGRNTFVPPGPVYFMALGIATGLGTEGLRVLQAGLGALTAALTVLLAHRAFGRTAAAAAGVGVAFYPYLIYIAGVFYTQNWVIPLLLLVVLALCRRQTGGSAGWLAAAGAGWGLAAHFMVPALLTAPPLAVWHWLRMRPRTRGFADAVILTGVTVLCLVPVTLRNYSLDGRFSLVASMGNQALYWANNPDTDPRDRDPARWQEVNIIRVREEQDAMGWTEAQTDSALRARALDYIARDPGAFLSRYAYRVTAMWAFRPDPFTHNAHTGSRQFLVAAVTSAPVILLALTAAVVFLPRFAALFPFYAIPLILTASFSFFHTTVRYRLTFEPLLIVLAAALVIRVVRPRSLGTAPVAGG